MNDPIWYGLLAFLLVVAGVFLWVLVSMVRELHAHREMRQQRIDAYRRGQGQLERVTRRQQEPQR